MGTINLPSVPFDINFEIVVTEFQMDATDLQLDIDLTYTLEIFDNWSFTKPVFPV